MSLFKNEVEPIFKAARCTYKVVCKYIYQDVI